MERIVIAGKISPLRKRHTAGFTLMETAVALLVMMVVGLGVSSLFTYAVRYNAGAAERSMALAVAQQQLEALRALPLTDPLLAPVNNVDICTSTAPCQSGNEPFTATKTITDTMNVTVAGATRATMKTITISVTPLHNGIPWTANAVSITAQRATLLRGPN